MLRIGRSRQNAFAKRLAAVGRWNVEVASALGGDGHARSRDAHTAILDQKFDVTRTGHQLQLEVNFDSAGANGYSDRPVLRAKNNWTGSAAGAPRRSGFPEPDAFCVGGIDRNAVTRVANAHKVNGRHGNDVPRD